MTAPRVIPLARALDEVPRLAEAARAAPRRYVLGIAGPPGAGKSTLAERVVEAASPHVPAAVAPMDGFHRSDRDLAARGLLPLKGVPASFDAEAFVAHLHRLHTDAVVRWPTYDRTRQAVVPAGAVVEADTKLVVVEGNYLLLDEEPWATVAKVASTDLPNARLVGTTRGRADVVLTARSSL